MQSLNQPFPTSCPKRRGLWLLPFVLSTGLLGLLFWLHTTPAVRGQSEDVWAAPLVMLDAATFPTITVGFICRGTDLTINDFFFYEDLQLLTPTTLYTEVATPPTQVAIVLDLYRSDDPKTMRKTAELITKEGAHNDLVDGLIDLRESGLFTGYRPDSLAIVLPNEADSAVPQSILTLTMPSAPTVEISKPLTFTYDLNSLINRLNLTEFSQALPYLRPEETTKLRDLLLQVLDTFEWMPGQRRSLLLLSNGADITSTASLTDVVQAARKRQIVIHTIYVDTTLPGDQEQLRFLADKTDGDFLTMTVNIGALLTGTLYQPVQRCHLFYRTRNPQPENVIILPKGPRAAAATVAITLPNLGITPPQITVKWPTPSTIITKEQMLYLENVIQWDLGAYANRRIVSITYEVKGPSAAGYRHTAALAPEWPYTIHKYITTTTALTPGNYLMKVTVVDELGLVGVDEQPFAVRVVPLLPTSAEKPVSPRPLTWREWFWQRVATLQTTFWQTLLPLPRVAFWSVVAAVLVGLLLLWLIRKRRYDPFGEGELILPPRYTAALVRVRMDPDAPPLLHMAPLGHREKIALPDYLYHPIGKNYSTNGRHQEFSQWYQATIEPEGDNFRIERLSNIDVKTAEQALVHREPIKILVAETAEAFTLIDDGTLTKRLNFGPLDDGDIIQLGNTHYKFIRIPPDKKDEPDAKSLENGKMRWSRLTTLRQRRSAWRWPAWPWQKRSEQAQPGQPALTTGANEPAKTEVGKNE